jgi:YD repeat-containing protein
MQEANDRAICRRRRGIWLAVTASAPDEARRTSHVTYDPEERVFPTQVWNDLGHTEASLYDPALGVVHAVEDANGVTTRSQYDDLGRTRTVADARHRSGRACSARGAGQGRSGGPQLGHCGRRGHTPYAYDDIGNLKQVFVGGVLAEDNTYGATGGLTR